MYSSFPVFVFLPLPFPLPSSQLVQAEIPPADIPSSTMMQGISLSELTSMSPQEQKQLLGERLFVRVLDIDPLFHDRDLAGKITGMLLEMDNAGIVNLLESQNALRLNGGGSYC